MSLGTAPTAPKPSQPKVEQPQLRSESEPEAETLPPAITSGGALLDQIIQDKQSRAERIATKTAERLAVDES